MNESGRNGVGRGRNAPGKKKVAVTTLLALLIAACTSGTGSPETTVGGDQTTTSAAGDTTTTAEGSESPETTTGEAPAGGGTLTVGLSQDPGELDPSKSNTAVANTIYSAICERLYEVSAEGEVVPQLAAAPPEFNEDNTSATISLRDDAVFADGTPMDAEAVKTSIDRHISLEESLRAPELTIVEAVTVVDATTVQVDLNAPIAPGAFDVIFSDKSGIVMSPTALEAQDGDFSVSQTCVGPFMLADRVSLDSVEVVKDPNYYAADEVQLDGIVFRVIEDPNVRAANLQSGDVDVIERVSVQDLESLEAVEGVEIQDVPGLGYLRITINVSNATGAGEPPGEVDSPLAADARVRQALELSIDRETINQVVYGGRYELACGFISPESEMASDEALACPPYDPERSLELLEEAGVTPPVQIMLTMPPPPEYRRIGEVMQSMLPAGGFELEIDPQESTSAADRAYAGDFQMFLGVFGGRLDPDQNIAPWVRSGSTRSMSNYHNSEVDDLLDQAVSAQDVDERRDLYAQIHQILAEDVPIIYLTRSRNFTAVGPRATGVETLLDGTVVLRSAAVTG